MAHVPENLANIQRVELVFPHPPLIQPLSRLQQSVAPQGPKLWICREDCNSGLAFGGNKVRKLEYVMRDAIDQGCDTVVTTGGIQSNHMRQTAAAGAHCGLKVVLVPKDMVHAEDPELYFRTGNVQFNALLGAETMDIGATEDQAMSAVRARGGKPYWIPSGASTHPLGGLGYAKYMCDVAQWEEEHHVHFDTILTAAASGSTLGGMIAGEKLSGSGTDKDTPSHMRRRLIGVGVFAKPASEMKDYISAIAKSTAEKVGLSASDISKTDFEINDRYNAGAYGRVDAATSDAVKLLATTEGILLDPVYTGKAMAGLLGMLQSGELKDARNILFLHTGGQAVMSAYPDLR